MLPRLLGGVVVCVGMVVLLGWLFGLPGLARVLPKAATMQVNVAGAFILAGAGLWVLGMPGAWTRYAVRVCALAMGALALGSLMECLSGWDWRLGEGFVRVTGAPASLAFSGCMALNDVLGFMLMAAALWLMSRAVVKTCPPWVLALLGGLLLGIGLVAMLGYLADVREGYSWWNGMAMPLPTAVLFLLLGVAVLQLAWQREGMSWWIGPRITLGFIGVFVMLVAVAANANRSVHNVMKSADAVREAHDVIGTLHHLQRHITEIQSGVRGFLLTGDEDSLRLAEQAGPDVNRYLATLRERSVNPQERLSVLERLIATQQESLQPLAASRRSAGWDAAAQLQSIHDSKEMMDQIRARLHAIEADETSRLITSGDQARSIMDHVYSVVPIGVLLCVLVLTLGFLRLNRETAKRQNGAEALRVASQKLLLHFEQTPMAVIEWDLDFRVTGWNPAAQTIFGFSSEEALGQGFPFIVPEECHPQVTEVLQALSTQTGGERNTNWNVCKNGRRIVCEWYNTPLIDEDGTFTGVASLVLDITENRRMLEMLAWEKNALEIIGSTISLHQVLDGLMRGIEQQMPGAIGSILLLGSDRVHLQFGAAPSLPPSYSQAIDGLAIGPTVGSCGTAAYFNRQVIVEDIDSDPLWADYRSMALESGLRACWSTPIHGRDGNVLGTFAIYYREPRHPTPDELDLLARAERITRIAIERKEADAALRLKNFVFDESIAANSITGLDGHLTEVNDAFPRLWGYAGKAAVVGLPITCFFQIPAEGEIVVKAITEVGQWEGEFTAKRKDSTTFIAHAVATVVRDDGGQIMGYQAAVLDITERKRSADFLRLVVNSIPDFVFWKDRDSVFLGCNNAFAKAAGMDSPDQIVGKTDYDLCWKKEESDFFVSMDRQVMENDQAIYHIIEPQRRAGGEQIWVETSKVPLHDEQNRVIGLLGSYLDITERKKAEDEIHELNTMLDQRVSERTAELEAVVHELDAFSYSVSHDLRAPLRAVDGFSRLLADDYVAQLDENGLRLLSVIRSETRRMGQLIDDLLAFSRLGREPLAQIQIDMQALAQAVFDELSEQETGRQLQFVLHPLPSAYGTQSMIRQVWVNLIGNAMKFTQERAVGEIEVGAEDGEDGVPVYYVKDNGAGFDMRYADKLFGVFQRLHTEKEFSGTGVGLALVHRIVHRHAGRIWADAAVDRGAAFYFTLPSPNHVIPTENHVS